MRMIMASIESEYRRYKDLGEGAIRQLEELQLTEAVSSGNSIATMVWHLAGNLKSRFTDFIASDGEKPWRDRESEFLSRRVARAELLAKWEEGWQILFSSLAGLSDADLGRTVTIRGQSLLVIEALQRSLAHASYHVGQIVYIAKAMRGASWHYLSIPPGQSTQYNLNPTLERKPRTI